MYNSIYFTIIMFLCQGLQYRKVRVNIKEEAINMRCIVGAEKTAVND